MSIFIYFRSFCSNTAYHHYQSYTLPTSFVISIRVSARVWEMFNSLVTVVRLAWFIDPNPDTSPQAITQSFETALSFLSSPRNFDSQIAVTAAGEMVVETRDFSSRKAPGRSITRVIK